MAEEAQNKQLDLTIKEEAKVEKASQTAALQNSKNWVRRYNRWLEIGTYAVFILAGQSAATLLGRLYFDRGGKSQWMGTLVQIVGFPILIPFLFIEQTPPVEDNDRPRPPSLLVHVVMYLVFGMLMAGSCLLYSIGMQDLTVSTFTLISASQLGFNALFAFLMKIQKLTPLIINSIFLLTISSVLLFFQPAKKINNAISLKGSICTLMGSALFGLTLALGQPILNNVLKKQTLKDVLDLIIIQSFVATCASVVGLFTSGEWKTLRTEMKTFELGQVSYVMTLFWTAVCWEMFTVGIVGMMLKVSGLFANVVTMLAVPVIPAAAVAVFHDEMSGVKVVSMVLAFWGFLSYVYQQYVDEMKMKAAEDDENVNGSTPSSQVQLVGGL